MFIGCVQTKVHAVKHFIMLAADLSGNGVSCRHSTVCVKEYRAHRELLFHTIL